MGLLGEDLQKVTQGGAVIGGQQNEINLAKVNLGGKDVLLPICAAVLADQAMNQFADIVVEKVMSKLTEAISGAIKDGLTSLEL